MCSIKKELSQNHQKIEMMIERQLFFYKRRKEAEVTVEIFSPKLV